MLEIVSKIIKIHFQQIFFVCIIFYCAYVSDVFKKKTLEKFSKMFFVEFYFMEGGFTPPYPPPGTMQILCWYRAKSWVIFQKNKVCFQDILHLLSRFVHFWWD